MEGPQKEKGYTAIANEIMEALAKIRIPGVERQCLDFILRKTYGFNKKCDSISLTQFISGTGLKKQYVQRALWSLKAKNIIITGIKKDSRGGIKKDSQWIKTYEFNKHYRTWKPSIKKPRGNQKRLKGGINNDLRQESKKVPTKVDCTKVDVTKVDTTSEVSENHIPLKLSKKLFSLILENDPKAKMPNLEKWAEHIEKLIRIDKRTHEEISHVIQWTQQDDFEMSNILSTEKLRKRFQQLWLKSNKPTKANQRFSKNVQAMEAFING